MAVVSVSIQIEYKCHKMTQHYAISGNVPVANAKLTIEIHILSLFCVGLIGAFTGLTIAHLVLSSHGIAYVLVDYSKYLASIIISLTLVHGLLKHVFKKKYVGIVWKYTILVLLSDFIIVFLAILYILVFNLLSMYYYPNPALQLCSLMGKLSDTELQIAGYVIMSTVVIFNMYLLNKIKIKVMHSSRIGYPRTTCCVTGGSACLLLLLISLSIIIPWYMSSLVNSRYEHILADFRNRYAGCSSISGELNCTWSFVSEYRKEFYPTYRMLCPKPKQLLVRLPPIIDNKDFVAKLAAVSRSGTCFDFAIGVTRVLKDLYGYKTRVVSFVGWDHTIPEVNVNGTWYVIDITYTTPHYPVKVSEYTEYLRENYPVIYASLKGMLDFNTGRDVSKEHGLYTRG